MLITKPWLKLAVLLSQASSPSPPDHLCNSPPVNVPVGFVAHGSPRRRHERPFHGNRGRFETETVMDWDTCVETDLLVRYFSIFFLESLSVSTWRLSCCI